MSTTLEQDLRGVASRHIGRASLPQLLEFIEQLGDMPESVMSGQMPEAAAQSSEPRFLPLVADGSAWLDAQDGEHVAVRDHQTGLEWSAGIIGEGNWDEAKKLASVCTLLGKSDWRVPTVHELLTLVDYERCDPAVDPEYFQGPYGYTWSSTPAAKAPGYAWDVYLDGGYSSRYNQGSRSHVRAVRAGQALALGL